MELPRFDDESFDHFNAEKVCDCLTKDLANTIAEELESLAEAMSKGNARGKFSAEHNTVIPAISFVLQTAQRVFTTGTLLAKTMGEPVSVVFDQVITAAFLSGVEMGQSHPVLVEIPACTHDQTESQ